MLKTRWIFCIFFIIFVAANASSVSAKRRAIDQEPMYGGIDRSANAILKKGDEDFITGVVGEWGTREKASRAFVEQGIRFYRSNDYSKAMKRFNQAWLLDPRNPDVFWGFSIIFHDKKNLTEAKKMIDQALELNLSNPLGLCDAGRIYALFAVESRPSLDEETKRHHIKKSDELYEAALKAAPGNDYIYESWTNALYYEGEYARAWEKINQGRQFGMIPSGWLINNLQEKMREPKE